MRHNTALVFLTLLASACSAPDDGSAGGDPSSPVPCEINAPASVTALGAFQGGVAFAFDHGGDDGVQTIRRAYGAGCDLAFTGPAIAAGALLDVDEAGRVYVFPAEANDDAEIGTMLPGEFPGSMAAAVDLEGAVHKVTSAGRGIWGFGVSPAGDAVWQSACGPEGVFSVSWGSDGAPAVTPSTSLSPSATLWQQAPALLTDAGTLWSVGPRTCAPGAPLDDRCGFDLVRTTAAGSDAVAHTLVDLGRGFERATLSRCGPRVCGALAGSGVVAWSERGAIVARYTAADLDLAAGETVASVTGSDAGVYALVRDDVAGRGRVVFVRWP